MAITVPMTGPEVRGAVKFNILTALQRLDFYGETGNLGEMEIAEALFHINRAVELLEAMMKEAKANG